MKLKFYFQTDIASDRVNIYLIGEKHDGSRYIAKPMNLAFEPIDRNNRSSPSLEIEGFESREFLPALANALAEAGYRHESTEAGELKATKNHLEDMRKIVFTRPLIIPDKGENL